MTMTTNRNAFELAGAVTNASTWTEALVKSSLNWDVEKIQLQTPTGKAVNAYGIVRKDSGLYLGTVKETYEPVNNSAAFGWLDDLVKLSGNSSYSNAGALDGGKKVYAQVALPSLDFDIRGLGDKHKAFATGLASHDGSKAIAAAITAIRVICQNTYNAAYKEAALKIRHTRNAAGRLIELKDAVKQFEDWRKTAEQLKATFEELSVRRMTRASMTELLDSLFPGESGKTTNQKTRVLSLYGFNDNDSIPEYRGTAFAAFNALTAWSDHERSVRGAGENPANVRKVRAERAIFGTGDSFKREALSGVLEATKNAERIQPVSFSFPSSVSPAAAAQVSAYSAPSVVLELDPESVPVRTPPAPQGGFDFNSWLDSAQIAAV